MTVLAGLLALVLHAALLAAAVPVLAGGTVWLQARLAGRQGLLVQPWQDWRRLLRKRPKAVEGRSAVTRYAPSLALAATATAALLVPSFTLGMVTAPASDLLVIGGLLGLARASLALLAMDTGTAPGGLAASRFALRAAAAGPVLLLTVLVLALSAGSTNADAVLGVMRDSGPVRVPVTFAAVALAVVALADGWDGTAGPMEEDRLAQATPAVGLGGAALLQVTLAELLRRLTWLSLLAAVVVPAGMAAADGGLLAWAVGIVAWGMKVAVLAAGQAGAEALVPPPRLAGWLGLALAAAAIGVLLLFVRQGMA